MKKTRDAYELLGLKSGKQSADVIFKAYIDTMWRNVLLPDFLLIDSDLDQEKYRTANSQEAYTRGSRKDMQRQQFQNLMSGKFDELTSGPFTLAINTAYKEVLSDLKKVLKKSGKGEDSFTHDIVRELIESAEIMGKFLGIRNKARTMEEIINSNMAPILALGWTVLALRYLDNPKEKNKLSAEELKRVIYPSGHILSHYIQGNDIEDDLTGRSFSGRDEAQRDHIAKLINEIIKAPPATTAQKKDASIQTSAAEAEPQKKENDAIQRISNQLADWQKQLEGTIYKEYLPVNRSVEFASSPDNSKEIRISFFTPQDPGKTTSSTCWWSDWTKVFHTIPEKVWTNKQLLDKEISAIKNKAQAKMYKECLSYLDQAKASVLGQKP